MWRRGQLQNQPVWYVPTRVLWRQRKQSSISKRSATIVFILFYFILTKQKEKDLLHNSRHPTTSTLNSSHQLRAYSNTLILCLNWTGVSLRFSTVWIACSPRRECLRLIIFSSCSPEKRENCSTSGGGPPCKSDGDARQKFKLNL